MGRRNLRSVGGGAPSSLGENARAEKIQTNGDMDHRGESRRGVGCPRRWRGESGAKSATCIRQSLRNTPANT